MARVFSDETIERMRASAQRRWSVAGKPRVEIPAWVPMKLRDEYRRKAAQERRSARCGVGSEGQGFNREWG